MLTERKNNSNRVLSNECEKIRMVLATLVIKRFHIGVSRGENGTCAYETGTWTDDKAEKI